MNAPMRMQRRTKYCLAIEKILTALRHATNTELLTELRKTYPDLSATTVHRATARLAARGVIAIGPAALDGSIRYDANVEPHDHFMCNTCGKIRDTNVKNKVTHILESAIDDCHISGRLTIAGTCSVCSKTST